jgi:hypothetical protein
MLRGLEMSEGEELQPQTVQTVGTALSVLNHLRQNRIEYALLTVILYVTGLGADLWATTAGMCI